MKIAGLAKTSTIDFPGHLAAVIFTSGCNLDCFYCHNRHLIQADNSPQLDLEEVYQFLTKRQGLLDGIVLSGGEPLLQEDLPDFISAVRRLGYAIKLDTNGTLPDVLRSMLKKELLDYVAVDYKAPFSMYADICGCSPLLAFQVRTTLKIMLDSDISWEARTTVIPQLSQEELIRMAREIPQLPRYYLQPYKRPHNFRAEDRFRIEARSLTPAGLVLAADNIRPFQPSVSVRGHG